MKQADWRAGLGIALGLLTLPAGRLAAQAAAEGTPAPSYDASYGELGGLAPTDQVAPVKGLVLRRDAAEFTLDSGSVVLLSPVGGRTVAVAFTGLGTFRFTPPAGIERERLKLFRKADRMEEPFSWTVLLFSDSTLGELGAHATFGPGRAAPQAADAVGKAVNLWTVTADFFKPDKDAHYVPPDLMATLLNGDRSGYFTAALGRDGADPWQVTVNPAEREAVSLTVKTKIGAFTKQQETATRFRRQGDTASAGERASAVSVRQYAIEVWLPETGTGDIHLSAAATLQLSADAAAGPWLAFSLFGKLDVDSATWGDGTPIRFFKGHLNPHVWVLAPHRLSAGETPSLHLYYHGDVVDRWGSELFTMPSVAFADWYPAPLDGRNLALFDITLHSPEGFLVSAVGDRADSAAYPGHMITTRWRTPAPVRNATFNLGIFEPYRLEGDDLPPIELHWSDKIGRLLSHNGIAALKHPKEEIGADLQSAMKFYRSVYGDPPFKHFYAGEVPYPEGLAYPGMVDLSLFTGAATPTGYEGFDQIFRAHETAHQWWGIAVDFSTYHDQWLSEGFSDFSGLWYLQTRTAKNDLYFGTLDRWRDEILRRRDKPVPISLGYRMDTSLDESSNYNVIVYEKGAWVLHMLRMLTLNMQSMSEERFKEIMRDFYAKYRGQRASTLDFQRVVEQHVGQPMDWFFREWVDGWRIPTYKVANRTEPAENGQFRVKLRVLQENVPDDFVMYVPVTIDLGNNKVARVRVKVQGPKTEVDLPLMPSKPKEVRFNDFHGVLAEVKNVDWN